MTVQIVKEGRFLEEQRASIKYGIVVYSKIV